MSDREFWDRIVPKRLEEHREWQERVSSRRASRLYHVMLMEWRELIASEPYTANDFPQATVDILNELGK